MVHFVFHYQNVVLPPQSPSFKVYIWKLCFTFMSLSSFLFLATNVKIVILFVKVIRYFIFSFFSIILAMVLCMSFFSSSFFFLHHFFIWLRIIGGIRCDGWNLCGFLWGFLNFRLLTLPFNRCIFKFPINLQDLWTRSVDPSRRSSSQLN